jgi:hypothetical protein
LRSDQTERRLVKRLPPPKFDAKEAVELCATGITIPERSKALLDALSTVVAGEGAYMKLGPIGELFQIPTTAEVTPELNGKLMAVIYKSHFARVGAPTRGIYDAIRLAPKYGICPLCGQRSVGSVDHYLPQSLHPIFNLTPVNLIPSCTDCNKAKLAKVALTAEQQTLHPYFDDLGDDRWLVADILESNPLAIKYRVRPPSYWTPVLAERVKHHFEVMGIAVLYAAQAASELADISHALVKLGNSGGASAVRSHLYEEFASRLASDKNSWKTALYESLCLSAWFCNEGFRLVN